MTHDPRGSHRDQTIFWAPEALPSVVPIKQIVAPADADTKGQSLTDRSAAEVRRAPDGWHAVVHMRGNVHHLWSQEPPIVGARYVAELPFDFDFEDRAYAARRLWSAINGRAPGPAFHELSAQRRQRLGAALRALDGRMNGGTYRAIAEVLFGAKRIPERAWKTHDLGNRTIRLVQSGLALMRGGYRGLLRRRRKGE